jgi:hypothetical protein
VSMVGLPSPPPPSFPSPPPSGHRIQSELDDHADDGG